MAAHGGSGGGGTVVVEVSPADLRFSSGGRGGGRWALAAGVVLALHTPAWVILVFCREDLAAANAPGGDGTLPGILLRFPARWILGFTPWIANALLSVFLGVLFVCLGAAALDEGTEPDDHGDDDDEKKKKE